MTLRLLGAGGAFTRRWGTTCSMITLPSGLRWLVDCGRQAPDQLYAAGFGWEDIEGQIVTHVHGDHVGGFEEFAFRRFYERLGDLEPVLKGGRKPKLITHSAVEVELWQTFAPSLKYLPPPLEVDGGTLEHYFERIPAVRHEPPQGNPWNHSETFEHGELHLVARETEHVPGKPCTQLEIAIGNDRVAYWSGDSVVNQDYLVEIEPRTSIYFHDCTFIDYPGQVHGAFALLEQLPATVRDKMVLMHHEDDIEQHRAQAEAAGFRVAMPGDVYDLVAGRKLE